MEGALVVGGVAEEADADLVAALHLDGLGNAGRERKRSADQCVAAHETVLHVEDVHGAAAPLADAGLLAKQLRHDRARVRAGLDGVHVIAIAGNDVVMTGPGRLQHTVGAGLFTRIQVQESADVAFDIGLVAALLETPCKQHFP